MAARFYGVDYLYGYDGEILRRQCWRGKSLIVGKFVNIGKGLQVLNRLVSIRPIDRNRVVG